MKTYVKDSMKIEAFQFGYDDFPKWAMDALNRQTITISSCAGVKGPTLQTFKTDSKPCYKGDYLVRNVETHDIVEFNILAFEFMFGDDIVIDESEINNLDFQITQVTEAGKYYEEISYESGMELKFAKSFNDFIGNKRIRYKDCDKDKIIEIDLGDGCWAEVREGYKITREIITCIYSTANPPLSYDE
jgi:hypothetical protein